MTVVFQISEINGKFTTAFKQFVNSTLFLLASFVVGCRNPQHYDPALSGVFYFLQFDNKFYASFPRPVLFLLSFVKPAPVAGRLFCYHFKLLFKWKLSRLK